MVILHIETSATTCSVALSEDEKCLFFKADDQGRNHASLLSVFIEESLQQLHELKLSLHAVAVSSGPGSYTGLRIGVSTAKGICYALDTALISINTLDILASQAIAQATVNEEVLIVPMIDARRMEVFNAVYDHNMNTVRNAQAEVLHPESFQSFLTNHIIYFSGDGAPKFREITDHENARFIADSVPDARTMIALAVKKYKLRQFEDVAYFEPQYVKEFFTTARPVQTLKYEI